MVRKKKTTMDITTYLNKKFKRGNSSCSLLEQYESYVKLLRFDMNHNDLNKTTLKMKMGNSIIEYEISEDNLLLFILTEYLNQSPIWEVEIIFNEVLHKPLFKIILNTSEVAKEPFYSAALQCFLSKYMSVLAEYDYENMKSYLPSSRPWTSYESTILCPPRNENELRLFQYQIDNILFMIDIENSDSIHVDLNYYFPLVENQSIAIGPSGEIRQPGMENELKYEMKTKGGIFSDEMGLGKTMTCLKLIEVKPRQDMHQEIEITRPSFHFNFKFKSKATVIVCPSHLTQHWLGECKKNFKHSIRPLKYILIVSKPSFQKLSYYEFMTSDIIIISQQFLLNCQYYPRVRLNPEFSDQIKSLIQLNSPSQFCSRLQMIDSKFPLREEEISFLKEENEWDEDMRKMKRFQLKQKVQSILEPNLEHFEFHRLILDEGHEIFGLKLKTDYHAEYLKKFLCSIFSVHKWFVSGTPFVSTDSLRNTLDFLNFRLYQNDSSNEMSQKIAIKDKNKSYLIDIIMKKIMIRHTKSDVEDQISIPDYEEEIVWVSMSDIEQQIYQNFVRTKESDINLQKLCCHIFLTHKNYNASHENVDLASVKEELIEYHSKNLKKYIEMRERIKLRLEKNHNNAMANIQHMPSIEIPTFSDSIEFKKTEEKISEAKYMIQVLEKYSCFENSVTNEKEEQEEECCICLDVYKEPILTKCGHKFCKFCITENLKLNFRCPICKVSLREKEQKIRFIELNPVRKSLGTNLNERYGSKLGMLITKLQELVMNKDNRIIIFSQWDGMLSIIGKTLEENNISNVFVKGNVFCRNNSILKFRDGVQTQVIMLSLDNAASGTNLNNATHIIFVEPINVEKNMLSSIEKQALGRACRLGQNKKVKILRIITRNTIEETIFKDKYLPSDFKGDPYSYHTSSE